MVIVLFNFLVLYSSLDCLVYIHYILCTFYLLKIIFHYVINKQNDALSTGIFAMFIPSHLQ
jgi:hypothetical protein